MGGYAYCSGLAALVYLYWLDNSWDETLLVVSRRLESEPETSSVQIGWLGPNTTYFFDYGVASGQTYVYRIEAINACGAAASAPLTITIPDCASGSGPPPSSSAPPASSSSGASGRFPSGG